jgi:hypothetical protein
VSMLGHGTAPGGGRAEPDRGPMTSATRAIASRHEVVHADTMGSTVVTAEIPAVPIHPRSYGVLLPDGSVWYPGSKRRLPAPWPLRFVVWVLALMLLLMLAGLAVVKWHPSWLATLRHTVGSAPSVGVGGPPGSATTQPGQTTAPPSQLDQWSCTPGAAGETCDLGVSTYTLDFITTGRCDVQITSSPSQKNIYVGVQAANQTQTFTVTGSSTVLAYAGGASVKIYSGSTLLGQISTVKYDYAYTFEPASDVTGTTSAPSST